MIGIVGGVGPLAGVDLATKLIAETTVIVDQEHLPFLLISIPAVVPDRTQFLLGSEAVNPAFALSNLLTSLEHAGVTTAAIACNTAHAPVIFDEVMYQLTNRGSQLQVVHLIETTVAYLNQVDREGKVGILASLGTWKFGLYRQPLEQVGLSVADLPEDLAKRVHEAIYDTEYGIKARSKPISEHARREVLAAMDYLVDAGATRVILGCTELPLVFDASHHRGALLVDPTKLVARKLIAAISPEKLRLDLEY